MTKTPQPVTSAEPGSSRYGLVKAPLFEHSWQDEEIGRDAR